MTYDDPTLSNVEFLRAVRRDPSVPIQDRVKAASALLELDHVHGQAQPRVRYRRIVEEPSLTIKIQCISDDDIRTASYWREWVAFSIEQQTYFNSLPKHEQDEITRAVARLERCNELDTGPLTHMSEVKGHG